MQVPHVQQKEKEYKYGHLAFSRGKLLVTDSPSAILYRISRSRDILTFSTFKLSSLYIFTLECHTVVGIEYSQSKLNYIVLSFNFFF